MRDVSFALMLRSRPQVGFTRLAHVNVDLGQARDRRRRLEARGRTARGAISSSFETRASLAPQDEEIE
ncbi:Hypothetical protein BN69_2101 [Methylocystis sp. SC2]|nr:Hypothetical protein BN69_2101 [Methylocystis sp. SC2]